MTRKDHLVQLVAAQLTRENGIKIHRDEMKLMTDNASELLAEIEKALGETRDEGGRLLTMSRQHHNELVAKAVAEEAARWLKISVDERLAEREKNAVIADGFMTSVGDAIAHRIRSGK